MTMRCQRAKSAIIALDAARWQHRDVLAAALHKTTAERLAASLDINEEAF